MLNFFRKTRKQLAEDNKPLKYMRYAIGEIVLVVIGILIALGINNWNEDKNMHKRELTLLSELSSNLEINITNLENDINTQTKSIKSFNYIFSLPKNKRPYIDS